MAWLGLDWMGWQDWTGATCYLILAMSYLVTSMLWLRSLAVVSLALEAIYFIFAAGEPLWVGIFWSSIFVLINVVQLWRLAQERLRARLSAEEMLLHRGPFAAFTRTAFSRLLRAGAWRDLPAATLLTREGEPVPELLVIGSGTARVAVHGRDVALMQPGAFIGEMSLMMQGNAIATVTTMTACRVFAIAKPDLAGLCTQDTALGAALHRVIGRDLALKLTETHAA